MILRDIAPRSVMGFFEELCAIPHCSGNTKAVSDYCVRFAAERGLEYYQDSLNNVIIIKPASPGYESSPAVILQGHLDMVCAVDPGCPIDMSRDGLDLAVEGDHIFARGTTLGGDDGIAVAMALAVLDDASLPHPRLEAVFTVEEETGMDGARGLDVSPLTGRTMLNIDSEEEGVFTVSCAGGVRANCSFPAEREPVSLASARITLDGLKGGHSGVEIHTGRGNANILMGRVLRRLWSLGEMRLIALEGGSADNAIPLSCTAAVAFDPALTEAVAGACGELEAVFQNEYRVSDPGVRVRVETAPVQSLRAVTAGHTKAIIDALGIVPNGVQAMSLDIPGLVETSLNLGILRLEEDALRASFSIRSSVGSRKEKLKDKLTLITELLGGSIGFTGEYPAWEYKAESPLRDKMVEVYRRQYGAEPQVLAIHAGLECGLLSAKLPGLDCVSFGPNMLDIHTTKERISISSVQRVWEFLLEVLKELK
ncbi:MAG: aminoacyl-histidine dipeptidase [Oscillospiraceae bacterium]